MEQVVKIFNGQKQPSIFSEKEMDGRLFKLRESMQIEKIDAVEAVKK